MPQSNYERKPIPGFPGYFADTNGDIWSTKKGNYIRINPCRDHHGYLVADTYQSGKRKARGVHRLVAITFLPNPSKKEYVCHKNDIPTDNRVLNLFWGTPLENSLDCTSKKRRNSRKGESHGKAKLTEKQVIKIRNMRICTGATYKKISEFFNIKPTTVQRIINNKGWTHI